MQGWQYGNGIIYFKPIFRLTKLAFLRARATHWKGILLRLLKFWFGRWYLHHHHPEWWWWWKNIRMKSVQLYICGEGRKYKKKMNCCSWFLRLFMLPWCSEMPQNTRYSPRRKGKQSTNTTLHFFFVVVVIQVSFLFWGGGGGGRGDFFFLEGTSGFFSQIMKVRRVLRQEFGLDHVEHSQGYRYQGTINTFSQNISITALGPVA